MGLRVVFVMRMINATDVIRENAQIKIGAKTENALWRRTFLIINTHNEGSNNVKFFTSLSFMHYLPKFFFHFYKLNYGRNEPKVICTVWFVSSALHF